MQKTRYITDAALLSALLCIILFINRQSMNFFDEFMLIILPLPVSFYVVKHGRKKGFLLLGSVFCLSFLFTDPIRLFGLVCPAICAGYFYGLVYLAGYEKKAGLIIKIFCTLIINLLTTIILAEFLYGISAVEEMSMMAQEIGNVFQQLQITDFSISLITAVCVALIPSVIIIVSIFEGYLVHLLFSVLRFRLLKIGDKQELKFELQIPKMITIFLLIIMIGTFATISVYSQDEEYLKISHAIFLNISMVAIFFFIAEGIMFSLSYSKKHHKIYPYLLIVICVFVFPFLPLIIGIIDSIGGYQKKINLSGERKINR